jgi:hypothetical protein
MQEEMKNAEVHAYIRCKATLPVYVWNLIDQFVIRFVSTNNRCGEMNAHDIKLMKQAIRVFRKTDTERTDVCSVLCTQTIGSFN